MREERVGKKLPRVWKEAEPITELPFIWGPKGKGGRPFQEPVRALSRNVLIRNGSGKSDKTDCNPTDGFTTENGWGDCGSTLSYSPSPRSVHVGSQGWRRLG